MDNQNTFTYHSPEEDFLVELPPGTYYVGDPCYVLPDDRYAALISSRFLDHEPRNAVVDTPEGRLVVWGTGGDGVFDISVDQLQSNFKNDHSSLAVDSGSLAFIPVALATRYDPREPAIHPFYGQIYGHIVLDDPHTVLVQYNGNVDTELEEDGPNLSILVADEDEDEDEDD